MVPAPFPLDKNLLFKTSEIYIIIPYSTFPACNQPPEKPRKVREFLKAPD